MLFVDFVKAFDTVPPSREMLFKVPARLGFPPKIISLARRVFHENVTLEVDLDDDGNTIIIKSLANGYPNIGPSKVTRSLRLELFLPVCYIQAVLGTLFPSSRSPPCRH